MNNNSVQVMDGILGARVMGKPRCGIDHVNGTLIALAVVNNELRGHVLDKYWTKCDPPKAD